MYGSSNVRYLKVYGRAIIRAFSSATVHVNIFYSVNIVGTQVEWWHNEHLKCFQQKWNEILTSPTFLSQDLFSFFAVMFFNVSDADAHLMNCLLSTSQPHVWSHS